MANAAEATTIVMGTALIAAIFWVEKQMARMKAEKQMAKMKAEVAQKQVEVEMQMQLVQKQVEVETAKKQVAEVKTEVAQKQVEVESAKKQVEVEVAKKEVEVAKKEVEVAQKLVEMEALKNELTFSNFELLTTRGQLYPRVVFEKYENQLECACNPKKNLSRGEKWKMFVTTRGWKFDQLRQNLQDLGIDDSHVPNIAMNLYSLLSEGIHNGFRPGHHKVIIDKGHLPSDHAKLMIAICKSYPLGDHSYEIVENEIVEKEIVENMEDDPHV